MIDKRPDINAFPAQQLGAFLRAMADPRGSGHLSEPDDHDIARLEQSIDEARRELEDRGQG